jgi:Na+/H+ antiporter NhaD/arsenite permease-like protein
MKGVSRSAPKPAWYKNTYFWIGGVLLILAIVGFVVGEHTIRDPGQKREGNLSLLYLAGAVIMLLNGWLSHRQTVQHYHEAATGVEE